jgi:hypothetical protein
MDSVPKRVTTDNESMDSSDCSQHSEPEGKFRDDNEGFIHIPQPLPAPIILNRVGGLSFIPE